MLDLVIALTHTRHRLTKAQIQATVRGYGDAATTEAFERMFERDKQSLRDLGIPLVTLTDAVHEDEVGYRIDTASYELPDINLSAAQMGVLSVAAQVWQDSGFAGAARRGLTKLRAVTESGAEQAQSAVMRRRGPDPVIADLLDAIAERAPISFRYRAANSGVVARRQVQPWRVYAQDRGWYLEGHDIERDAARSFRTSRIVGSLTRSGPPGSFNPPSNRQPPTPDPSISVRLAVRPGTAAALRARGEVVETVADPDGGLREVLTMSVADLDTLASDIAAYGESVVALAPLSLQQATMRRLQAVAALGEAKRHD